MTEDLSPGEAARLVADARRWEGSLQQRTEGITWMVWGIATAGLFLSYGAAGGNAPDWYMALLWVPWVVVGNLTSYALWRSAALTKDPSVPPMESRRHLALILVFVAVFGATTFVLKPTSWSVPMILVGVVWSLLGLLIPGMSRRGRTVSAVIGLSVVAAAFLITLVPRLHPLLDPVAGYGFGLATTSVGLIAVAGGFWQTLRA